MQHATNAGYTLSNPYATQGSIPVFDVQLLLLAAVGCFVVGILLAEQTMLRRVLSRIDTLFTPRFVAGTEEIQ